MKKYKHLFFDLDRTLWDFESNSLHTLEEIYFDKNLNLQGIDSFESFHDYYQKYNHHLWDLYKLGEIKKDHLRIQRFRGTLEHFNIFDELLASQIADDYVSISPTKTKLFSNSIEVLKILHQKYKLHIITNGFSEVQFIKLEKSGLSPFFEEVITSEMLGVQKPNPSIFQFSLDKAGALVEESIMIGDDQETDILGAQSIGMDQIFVDFDHQNLICKPTFHVHQLVDLLKIF